MSHDWEKTLIPPDSTIKHALEIIDNEAMRVALVVDQEQRLLGVVSDGDIRRGLLNDLSLSNQVSEVMNPNPTTVLAGGSKEEHIRLMESKSILSLPVIDENRKVIGLETLHGALLKPKQKNPVFIMAGGFGTRLRPLTDTCPKPMLKIGDKPILETLIRSFTKAGFVNFYISTHYMPEQIRGHFGDGSDLGMNICDVYS